MFSSEFLTHYSTSADDLAYSRVRNGTDERIGAFRHKRPPCWRVGQLDPVELGLLPRRVLDDCVRSFRQVHAPGAGWAQFPIPNLTGQRWVGAGKAQRSQFFEYCRSPEVPMFGEPRSHRGDKHLERVRVGALGHSREAFSGQV